MFIKETHKVMQYLKIKIYYCQKYFLHAEWKKFFKDYIFRLLKN